METRAESLWASWGQHIALAVGNTSLRSIAERHVAGVSVPARLARSGPMTTTTSIPVVPVTGAVTVSGYTAEGLTPSSEAMRAASGCLVGA
jgi:hypothetical protein